MITLDIAKTLDTRDLVHFTGVHPCTRTVGPRGGVTTNITVCRVNGRLRTWVRDPQRWELPVKHGMREYGMIHNQNSEHWHIASDCPVNP